MHSYYQSIQNWWKFNICFNVWVRVNSALPFFYPFSSLEAQFRPLRILRDYFLNQKDNLISDVNFLHFYFVYNKSIFIIKKSQTRPKHLKKAVVLRDYCLISHQTWKDLVQCLRYAPVSKLCTGLRVLISIVNYVSLSWCPWPYDLSVCVVPSGECYNVVYKGLHTACTFNVKCNKYTSRFLLTGYVGLKCNAVSVGYCKSEYRSAEGTGELSIWRRMDSATVK